MLGLTQILRQQLSRATRLEDTLASEKMPGRPLNSIQMAAAGDKTPLPEHRCSPCSLSGVAAEDQHLRQILLKARSPPRLTLSNSRLSTGYINLVADKGEGDVVGQGVAIKGVMGGVALSSKIQRI